MAIKAPNLNLAGPLLSYYYGAHSIASGLGVKVLARTITEETFHATNIWRLLDERFP